MSAVSTQREEDMPSQLYYSSSVCCQMVSFLKARVVLAVRAQSAFVLGIKDV